MFSQHTQHSFRPKPTFKLIGYALCLTVGLIVTAESICFGHASSLAAGVPVAALPQEASSMRRLTPGQPVAAVLRGGETHLYQIDLRAGDFLYLIVEQKGLDVAVSLIGPDDKEIIQVDGPDSSYLPEPLWHIAEVAGAYKVSVRSSAGVEGNYQIQIVEQHAATDRDRRRADGQRELLAGAGLLAMETAESAKQAGAKFQSARELWRQSGDPLGEADALTTIGRLYSFIDEREKALELYTSALALVRAAGDKRREAYLLHLFGEEYITSTAELKPQAISYYLAALTLMRDAGDRWGEALVMNSLALTYASLTETQKAFEYFVPLLALDLALGDRANAAITLNYLGGLYSWQGDYQKALDHYTQALPLNRAVGDAAGEQFTLRNTGSAYFGLGDYERALSFDEQSLRMNQKDREVQAYALIDIGAVYAKLGDLHKALEFYNQALPICRELKSYRLEGSALNNIGSAYRELGDYQRALDFYDQARPLKHSVGDRRGEAAILINTGKVELLLGHASKSLDSYRQALEISQTVGDQRLEAQALDGLAAAHGRLGNLNEALKFSEGAIEIVESLRAKIATRELRASYHASVQQYYEAHIDLLMRLHQAHPANGYDVRALEAGERSRARSLLESLSEAGIDLHQGVEPQLLERERSIEQQLHSQAERHMRLLSGKHTEEQAAASLKETDALLAAFNEVEGQIRIHSPNYAALTQPITFSLKEIQQQLLDPDTLLLEYSLGDERSFVWAVSKDSLASFTLPKRSEIETAARRVYDLLTARNRRVSFETGADRQARIARADSEFNKAASALSEMLLAPLAGQLRKNRLLIVGDGALNYIPFAALPLPKSRPRFDGTRDNARNAVTRDLEPLIVEHEVLNLPSALSLAVLRRELAGRKPAPKTLAVLADPVFEKDDVRVRVNADANKPSMKEAALQAPGLNRSIQADLLRSIRDTGGDGEIAIRRLPFTRRESNQIAALLPSSEGKEALDFAASRALATSGELSQYRYVHFATHGFLNSTHPELSGIVLSLVDENGADQEGFLRAYEIFNLKLPAEMVVLSGCRTGLGKEIKGEGLVGLTRGFMYAGAARVMVSLWDVSDEASAELMTEVYRAMWGQERLRPAAALRAAQLKIWKQSRWRAPYYWAAFVLQGEPR